MARKRSQKSSASEKGHTKNSDVKVRGGEPPRFRGTRFARTQHGASPVAFTFLAPRLGNGKAGLSHFSRSTSPVKRYLGALIEHTDDKFHVLKEYMDGKFDSVDKRFGDVGERLDRVEKRLNSHTEMIGNLSIQLVSIKEDLEEITDKLTKKVEWEEFETLRRRVITLERRAK